eukprot:gnl/MRDRNA2_/MRDRNA2_33382_c0_seq1.p1 gnl/MRDRNA2_/MRDRNA2_33382_c0~~gnl/MRDRNA2_/MRDRNA2_33382_c0_seq1.p1  ORF type:complete len:338 (+),score=55.27 gnl/MRDRNA2_/MRDRNA2_33382_c0_seq1:98-1111(+)
MIPRLSLANKGLSEELKRICRQDSPGIFFLRMPPSVASLVPQVQAEVKRFFALPETAKMALANDIDCQYRWGGRTFPGTGPGYRAVAADPGFALDARESFNIGREDFAVESSMGLPPPYGNKWPPEMAIPGFRKLCNMYSEALLQDVCIPLRRVLAEALGEKPDFLDPFFQRPTWLLGMVRYHPVTSSLEQRRVGIRPHQDDGIFTLLVTDGKPGLQVCPTWSGAGKSRNDNMWGEDLEWIDVPHCEDHFVVNLGTLTQRFSNGNLRAVLHRVVNSHGLERHSIPFFYEPNLDAVVAPTSGCVNPDNPACYKPVTPYEILIAQEEYDKQFPCDSEPA